jgi:DNA-directed RNA polymerase specialized sigma subunit
MKIRKIIGARPEISDEEVAKQTNLSINLVRETRNAYQVTYQEINEDTEMPVDGIDLNEDNLDRLLFDYKGVLEKIADLPENDYQFLMDVYVDKRANSTIFRKYAGVTTTEKIKEKTQAILSGILEDPCP